MVLAQEFETEGMEGSRPDLRRAIDIRDPQPLYELLSSSGSKGKNKNLVGWNTLVD
ncbi:hypothetical protein D9M69_639310 [compost metagenome]